MDILRMLTRSTNLQKALPAAKKSSDQHIPSAGLPGTPQVSPHESNLLPNSILEAQSASTRGTKRKRTESPAADVSDDSEVLDYFGTHHNKYPGKQSAGQFTTDTSAVEESWRTDTTTDGPERLSAEECKRILKSHKLKVTTLYGHGEALIREKNRRKELPKKTLAKTDKSSQLSPQPLLSFEELRTRYGISRRLLENLKAQGYKTPTEVQMGSLPLLLGTDKDRGLPVSKKDDKQKQSEVDLLTVAPTGSGKTLAFLTSTLEALMRGRHAKKGENSKNQQVQAIIIAPTHELADQIVNEGKKLARGTGIRISGMRKGMCLHHDPNSLRNPQEYTGTNTEDDETNAGPTKSAVKANILVTTPLLCLHALSPSPSDPPLALPSVHHLILDEADVLLDPLFRDQTLAIWSALTSPLLRTTLWSATIGSSIETLALTTLLSRHRSPPRTILRLIVGLADTSLPSISHRLVYAGSENGKLLALRQLLHPTASTASFPSLTPPLLVFTQTIPRATALHAELLYDIPFTAGGSSRLAVLHASLPAPVRSQIMADFRAGNIWVLITTDLLSRGVDFRGVNAVVNYDIPNSSAAYIHRVGRTGRAGREGGVAVTLYTKEDVKWVRGVANVIATSEKSRGLEERRTGAGVDKWLLDALPRLSKNDKKALKRGGVKERRPVKEGENTRDTRKMRISTKSGFDRRIDNNRKSAMAGTRRRTEHDLPAEQGDEGDWSGFND